MKRGPSSAKSNKIGGSTTIVTEEQDTEEQDIEEQDTEEQDTEEQDIEEQDIDEDTDAKCEKCGQVYTDAEADSWSGCDSCETWCHYWCAGLPTMLTAEDEWLCNYRMSR